MSFILYYPFEFILERNLFNLFFKFFYKISFQSNHYLNRLFGGSGATNRYPVHGRNIAIKHINISTVKNYGKLLDYLTRRGNGILPYSFLYSSCSTHTGLALNFAGVPTLFIHPYTVQASVWMWNQGFTPALIKNSYYLQNDVH